MIRISLACINTKLGMCRERREFGRVVARLLVMEQAGFLWPSVTVYVCTNCITL